MALYETLNAQRVQLTSDSWYIHVPHVMTVSRDVFEELWSLRDGFEQQHISMFGKRIPIPRRQGLFSMYDISYDFSGMSVPSQPITSHPYLRSVLEQVSSTHNAVFANWYESGKDSVGWHSDAEKELTPGSCIISISLGATRSFKIKKNRIASANRINSNLNCKMETYSLWAAFFSVNFYTRYLKKKDGRRSETNQSYA
eukprot:gene849-1335_t